MNKAQQLNARQRHYDRLHHQMRIADLDAQRGRSIPLWMEQNLRRGSEESLRLINDHGMSVNSVSLNDAAYLAELDQFEQQSIDPKHAQRCAQATEHARTA